MDKMKVIILAGGLQSTIENTIEGIPKPMAEIGSKPLLWHIMKNFSAHGFRDFIVCGGYKVSLIKEYFKDFYIYQSDITVDLQKNKIELHTNITENWNVTVVDTGLYTSPGERILQVQRYIGNEDFIVTYGDCLSDIDYNNLILQHKRSNKIATISVAKPTGRNEVLPIDEENLLMNDGLAQLPENQAWVNACCEVLKCDVFTYLERHPDLGTSFYSALAEEKNIVTYKHMGFWSPVETKRDQARLEMLWNEKKAPWKIWE